MAERVVPIGSIGEQNEWEIREDAEVTTSADVDTGLTPCPHAVNVRIEVTPSRHTVRRWDVPRTILVYTQAGTASTEVCAECVLEALRS